MIAMALGNIYGGKTADKFQDPDKLYGRIIIAAIWIALIPVVGKYIILGISALLIFTVSSNHCCLLRMHGNLRIPAVLTGNGHTVSGKILSR